MIARQIAIDGPAGAGKSTAAKMVAEKLGYLYIDTGAMYRAIALLAIRRNIDLENTYALTKLAQEVKIDLGLAPSGCLVFLDGEDVSSMIRTQEVSNAASPVSAVAGVRSALVKQQQEMATAHKVVMDGRDIGTVVLPDAECKIFLTASIRTRAERRASELQKKGFETDVDKIEQEIVERDYRDSNREHSPLRKAEDAYFLDNGQLSLEETVAKIIALAGGEE